MKNSKIYAKILQFSFWRMLFTLLGVLALIVLPMIAGALTYKNMSVFPIAVIVALVVGIVLNFLLGRYASYMLTCGQIAMIERGLTTGEMPKNVFKAGKDAVKARFATANVYFVLKGITSSITREITSVVNKLTDGDSKNDAVSTIGSLISIGIAVVLEYVNYCSLAWVFHKKEQNAFKSTCDGAVIYFQNWKALLANVGKILGITVLSLIVICIPLIVGSLITFVAVEPLMMFFEAIDAAFELELGTVAMVSAVVIGIMLWSGLHGAFVKPYIMVTVMRGYIAAGDANPPKVDIYGKLSGISKSFKKALGKAQESGEVMA